jgi:hypothetical protein
MADIWNVAVHPNDPALFATATEGSIIRVWNADGREMARATSVGFPCRSVTLSVSQ